MDTFEHDEDPLVEHIAEVVFKHFEAGKRRRERLSPAQASFVRVYAAQGIIDNGGLQYFFESDFEGQVPYSEICQAYRAVGAFKAAKMLEDAVALFDFANPHLDAEQRQARLTELWDDKRTNFAQLDNDLCGNTAVWQALNAFARANARRNCSRGLNLTDVASKLPVLRKPSIQCFQLHPPTRILTPRRVMSAIPSKLRRFRPVKRLACDQIDSSKNNI